MFQKSLLATVIVISAVVGAGGAAQAALVDVTSYSMNNGDGVASSSFLNYWDGTYSGAGAKTTDNAPLTGGTGALTDGVVAYQRWDGVDTTNASRLGQPISNISGTGEYVGWFTAKSDGSGETDVSRLPQITFNFASGHPEIHSVTFYVDASNNGLVGRPSSIEIGGLTYTINPTPGSGDSPLTVREAVAGNCAGANSWTSLAGAHCFQKLTALIDVAPSVTSISVELFPGGPNVEALADGFTKTPWIFVSEVQFDTTAVPEVSTWAMLLLGFLGLAFVRKRYQFKVGIA